jgi:hypothetical protein
MAQYASAAMLALNVARTFSQDSRQDADQRAQAEQAALAQAEEARRRDRDARRATSLQRARAAAQGSDGSGSAAAITRSLLAEAEAQSVYAGQASVVRSRRGSLLDDDDAWWRLGLNTVNTFGR